MDGLETLSFFLNFIFMLTIGMGYLSAKVAKKNKPIAPEISEIVNQVGQSLKQDNNWVYEPEKFKDGKCTRIDYWVNDKLLIAITFNNLAKNGKVIWEWPDTDNVRVLHSITPKEELYLREVIKDRDLAKLISKRIDLVSEFLDNDTDKKLAEIERHL